MKKQNLVKFMAAAVVSSTIFMSCLKENEPTPLPDKVQKLLYNWKITDITIPKVATPAVDSSVLKTCMTDDIIKFTTTGFDFQDGTAKCDSTLFPYAKGNWGYDAAKDSIRIGATTPQHYISWKVLKLNDSVLQVKYIDSLHSEDPVTKTISFKH